MSRYNPKDIEHKWQEAWAAQNIYAAKDFAKRPKFVMLTEFPYPSGSGMHIGHMREYTLGDILARHKRMNGFNVLFPMGFDAFGLPTENYAIKNRISPVKATRDNIANFEQQLKSMGFSFDWNRSFKTSDPDYYRWTQWLFLRFFAAGMAYQEEIAVNWCPFCKTGLANEEVINGRHERCDTPVEKKMLKQWLLRITDYADRLISGLDSVDYPPSIADQQVNWIGRSKGAEIDFQLEKSAEKIRVFTTRPDTIYGATFLVLAPEHPLVAEVTTKSQKEQINRYIKATQAKTDVERQAAASKEKTGVFCGAYAINPASQQRIPIWIADYILMGYGTGAIMAVPAHDERDSEFATKYSLPVQPVIEPEYGETKTGEITRDSIIAVLRNKKTNEVLLLNWGARQNQSGGRLLIGGGIERDEDIAAAAQREIREETGYRDVRFVQSSKEIVHNHYYSAVKERDCYAKITGLLFDLISDELVAPSPEPGEKGKFLLEWVPVETAAQLIDDPAHRRVFEELVANKVFTGEGLVVNSGKYDGLNSALMREQIVADLVKTRQAEEKINYRLKDWIFSRQHYWGEPIPIIHCPKHGPVAVPDDQLPVKLPPVEHYEPTNSGESPLGLIEDWVNVSCPVCGGPAKRETDTMPNWAGSSWYYLRYYDPHNDLTFAAGSKLNYWGMVDLYLGGMEHTTLHLLYSRFWHQFLFDQGLVPTPEPYAARRGQGIILAADNSKMSKSKGNVVNPTEIIESGYGADALRLAIIFLAPYDQTTPWSPEALGGTYRFLNRVWTLGAEFQNSANSTTGQKSDLLDRLCNTAIKKVSEDINGMNFNTAIAALMEYVNGLYKFKTEDKFTSGNWLSALQVLAKLLAPFAPHLSEQLWQELGNDGSIHLSDWPKWDPKFVNRQVTVIAVQINGKLRGELEVEAGITQEETLKLVEQEPKLQTQLAGKEIKRVIFVQDKLISLVVT
jgi:leucyl-tRNA synthetase